jgi:hypothetical protein
MCPTCGRVCNTTIGFYVPHPAFLSVTLYHVKTLLYERYASQYKIIKIYHICLICVSSSIQDEIFWSAYQWLFTLTVMLVASIHQSKA